MTTKDDTPGRAFDSGLGRRDLLRAGGLTMTLGALVAACGSSPEGAPGRVGYAPVPTALPTEVVDDAVHMRTATSIELTLVDVFGTFAATGELGARPQALLERLIEDHTAAAQTTAELTIAAGGEPYECTNAWYMDRVIPPILDHITGDEAEDIPPTDQPERDMLVVVNGLESMAASMYQQMVEQLLEQDLRADGMMLGSTAARHAAAVAILVTLAPDAYASPELFGEENLPDEAGLQPIFAIPFLFGSLAPLTVTVGAPSEAGTRFSAILETPAANSLIYQDMSCSA